MQKYQNNVQTTKGTAIRGASVFVYKADGSLASLYRDNGITPMGNPVVTDADGEYSFYVENGRYSLTVIAAGYVIDKITDFSVQDVGDLLSAATLALSAAQLAVLGVQDDLAAVASSVNIAVDSSQAAQISALAALGHSADAAESEYNAAVSKDAALAAKVATDRIYPGSFTTDPLVRPDGTARQVGDMAFNSTAALWKRWSGSAWIASDVNTAVLAASGGSDLVGMIQSGSGAVARTAQDKLRESVSVLDFIPKSEHAAIYAGTSTYDCLAAFKSALAVMRPSSSQSAAFGSAGPAIYAPSGTYLLSAPLEIKRRVLIFGDGSGDANSSEATVLQFPANSHGVIVHALNTIGEGVDSPTTKQGSGSILRGLHLKGTRTGSTTGHGVWMRGRAVVEDCVINNFSQNGVHLYVTAGSGGITEGNANNWKLYRLRISGVDGFGVYVKGADVNAGSCISVDCSSIGRGGFWDESFLGNTYMACHADSAGLIGSQVHYAGNRYYVMDDVNGATATPGTNESVWKFYGAGGVHPVYPEWSSSGTYKRGFPYFSNNANSRNIFVGCYQESGQPNAVIMSPATVIGGFLVFAYPESTGGILTASGDGLTNSNHPNGVSAAFKRADGTYLTTAIGGQNSAGTFLRFVDTSADATGGALRQVGKDIIFDSAGAAAYKVFTVTGLNTALTFGRSAPVPWVFNTDKFYLGNSNNARRQTTGTAAPTTLEWARGDIVWNINPSAAGVPGWMCVTAGTPGTWKAMAALAA